jgi:hypothetical protein
MWPFGGGSQNDSAKAPAATPTPAKHPAPAKPASSTTKAAPSPNAASAVTPAPETLSKHSATADATPAPAPVPKATPELTSAPAPAPAPTVNAASTGLPVEATGQEKDHYLQVRAQAATDPQVAGLLQKLHASEPGSDAYKTAAHKYNKAVFSKIRQLDPSLGDIDRRESAYDRRIDAGKSLAD